MLLILKIQFLFPITKKKKKLLLENTITTTNIRINDGNYIAVFQNSFCTSILVNPVFVLYI